MKLIIGDIHGCYAELQDLLDKAGLSADDEILACGDIVDRGPDSLRTLAFFQQQPQARSVQGNHERKHVRWMRGELKGALSQHIVRRQLGQDYPAAVAFMATLPLYLELPEAVLVHGYWEPGRPLHAQLETVLAGTMGGAHYLNAHYERLWYELYDGEKPLIVGHHHYLGNGQPLVYRDRVFGLDTGCCYGYCLTGLILPDFRFVSTPSRANYWAQAKASLQPAVPRPARRPAPVSWDEAGEAVLELIYAHIVGEHEQVLAQLRQEHAFESLPPHRRDDLYAQRVQALPLARFLTMAYRGELSLERLRRILKRPDHAWGFALHFGMAERKRVATRSRGE